MSEVQKPHELIASEQYWGNPKPLIERNPELSRWEDALDGFSSTHIFATRGAAKVMRLHRQARIRGYDTIAIPEGEPLPLVERGVGLLRIVEDAKSSPVPESGYAHWRSKYSNNFDPDTFDRLAQQVLEDKLYDDVLVGHMIPKHDDEQSAWIWRTAGYFTGSKTGKQLEGITSAQLRSSPGDVDDTRLMGQVIVGETYERVSKNRTSISKIIAADIILPHTVARTEVSE